MIAEYLVKQGAIGKAQAVTTESLTRAFHCDKRTIVDRVTMERINGALICSTKTGKGGYFMPKTLEEVERQLNELEAGHAVRSKVIQTFQEYVNGVGTERLEP